MADAEWTLDELVARVAGWLSDSGLGGPADRRVRQIPDRRAIRWYTTIGLLDRPELRGRTGWYGRRHLLQLVAIKRLQAAGRSLTEIQAELAGATDATLRRIAGDPGPTPDRVGRAERRPGTTARFWAAPVSSPDGTVTRPDDAPAVTVRSAVELGGGVTLLVTGVPDAEDLAAVCACARPLLDELARRGLADTHDGLADTDDSEAEASR